MGWTPLAFDHPENHSPVNKKHIIVQFHIEVSGINKVIIYNYTLRRTCTLNIAIDIRRQKTSTTIKAPHNLLTASLEIEWATNLVAMHSRPLKRRSCEVY